MDHAAAQPANALQRERHVGHGEVRQRCRVSRPGAPRVDPDRGPAAAGLTPGALPPDALLEAVVEQRFPEAARPLGVIRGELDQLQPRAGHRPNLPLYRAESAHVHTGQGRTRAASALAPGSPCSSFTCRTAGDLRDVRERRHLRSLRTGNTPEKLAEDARRARRGTPSRYRSSAVPALKAAVAMWLWRGPLRATSSGLRTAASDTKSASFAMSATAARSASSPSASGLPARACQGQSYGCRT